MGLKTSTLLDCKIYDGKTSNIRQLLQLESVATLTIFNHFTNLSWYLTPLVIQFLKPSYHEVIAFSRDSTEEVFINNICYTNSSYSNFFVLESWGFYQGWISSVRWEWNSICDNDDHIVYIISVSISCIKALDASLM